MFIVLTGEDGFDTKSQTSVQYWPYLLVLFHTNYNIYIYLLYGRTSGVAVALVEVLYKDDYDHVVYEGT